ncbi:hypothetical protein ACEXAF_22490, partial [Enterobacter hormaechei]|uniref:hypothetical protein n=1 Tax=Enterobacter hormaechei TaxID=158836 RepID=UPI0035A9010E
ARRPDSSADREPKGARLGLIFIVGNLLIGFQSRHATPLHSTPLHSTQERIRDILPSQCCASAVL